MKPIFVSRYVSTGETVVTGVTEVHESPLPSATMNSVVQCSIFHVIGDLNTYFLLCEHETQQLQEVPSVIDTCSTTYEHLKHTVCALKT